MQKKYLAYLALLAGWICFCYWLYAEELLPRYQDKEKGGWPVRIKDLKLPLAFNWGSDIPLAGEGYEDWVDEIEKVDTAKEIMIITGYYFRDEQGSIPLDETLALQRVRNMLKSIAVPEDKLLVQVLPKEINADVRSNPFEAIGVERIAFKHLLHMPGDTIELCFPLRDSLLLPPIFIHRLDDWLDKYSDRQDSTTFIVGIADGSGIAESADVALDRAIYLERKLIDKGWKADHIRLSTGQRSNASAIRNRCVIIYFD